MKVPLVLELAEVLVEPTGITPYNLGEFVALLVTLPTTTPVAVLAAIGSVVVCGCTIALISRTHKGEPLPAEEPLIVPAGGR